MFNIPRARLVFTLILYSLTIIVSPALSQESRKIDPLKFFDEHKRWYTGSNAEPWFYFSDIPDTEVRKSIEHWEEIGKDIVDLDGSLTRGIYAGGGSTHGSFLRYSQKKGFIWLHVDFCQGGPIKILRGRVEIVPEGVVLKPEITLGGSSRHSGHGQHLEPKQLQMVAIKWMNAVYLVQKEYIADFADYSAGLGDYNGNFPYMFDNPFLAMSIGDVEANTITYKPPVYPQGYEKYHKPPIRGAVISIGKGSRQVDIESESYDRLVTSIKIRLEKTAVFKSPIKLLVAGQEMGFIEEFELKSIRGNIATIEHSRLITKTNCVATTPESCKNPDHLMLNMGMVLSSNGL